VNLGLWHDVTIVFSHSLLQREAEFENLNSLFDESTSGELRCTSPPYGWLSPSHPKTDRAFQSFIDR